MGGFASTMAPVALTKSTPSERQAAVDEGSIPRACLMPHPTNRGLSSKAAVFPSKLPLESSLFNLLFHPCFPLPSRPLFLVLTRRSFPTTRLFSHTFISVAADSARIIDDRGVRLFCLCWFFGLRRDLDSAEAGFSWCFCLTTSPSHEVFHILPPKSLALAFCHPAWSRSDWQSLASPQPGSSHDLCEESSGRNLFFVVWLSYEVQLPPLLRILC
ncbi:hypothetical protein QBC47DRAFT_189124 [Echria macrotheca]|uniref:Uncharacterized protein n=1 Tax=Echria macrotheca TaxID=438768 RepID=A0AAJ0BBU7_9PEZI|nr:hypothetical protein QBC47DRAFT_189124 [Echria macrotheca]